MSTSTQHVLLTGGAGYLGSQVAGHLLARGMKVTVVDKLVYGGEALLAFRHHPGFSLVRGDVRDAPLLRHAMEGVDTVIHLAAVVGEDACAVDRDEAWSINVEGTSTIVTEASALGMKRFVFVSTCSNYGVAAPGELAVESSPLNPLSDYAKAKVAAERLVLAQNDLPCRTVLRLGTICGLSARMRFDLLVSEIARSVAQGTSIDIFAPDAWRPFLHVKDAARAFEAVIGAPKEKVDGKVFNVVGENVQKRDLAAMAIRLFPQSRINVTSKKPDLRDYQVDGSLIERELGFRSSMSIEAAFRETADAVAQDIFRNSNWDGHSAIPLRPAIR